MTVTTVILAAGQSVRFQGIKQLADIHGQPMVCHSLGVFYQDQQLLDGVDHLLLVLGAAREDIQRAIPAYVNTFYASNWAQGMGASLAQVLQVIPRSTTHLLVCLADQIQLVTTDMHGLLKASGCYPQQIIASEYANRPGVPAVFPSAYFSQLKALSGDHGARSLLRQQHNNTRLVAMPNAQFDIDTPEDLAKYYQSLTGL